MTLAAFALLLVRRGRIRSEARAGIRIRRVRYRAVPDIVHLAVGHLACGTRLKHHLVHLGGLSSERPRLVVHVLQRVIVHHLLLLCIEALAILQSCAFDYLGVA